MNFKNFFIILGIYILSRVGVACEFYSCVKTVGGVNRSRVCKASKFTKDKNNLFIQSCCDENEQSSCVQGEDQTFNYKFEKPDHFGRTNNEESNLLFISF